VLKSELRGVPEIEGWTVVAWVVEHLLHELLGSERGVEGELRTVVHEPKAVHGVVRPVLARPSDGVLDQDVLDLSQRGP
jgi:hypothetical protein